MDFIEILSSILGIVVFLNAISSLIIYIPKSTNKNNTPVSISLLYNGDTYCSSTDLQHIQTDWSLHEKPAKFHTKLGT